MSNRTLEDMEERARDGYADPEDMLYVLNKLNGYLFPCDCGRAFRHSWVNCDGKQ